MRRALFFIVLAACSRREAPPPQQTAAVGSFARTEPAVAGAEEDKGVALVELFTSEGCSSCPPADDVLASLDGDRVLTLEMHVDYWDNGGWRDPFSQAAFTARQQAYAAALGTQLFTPEMVVGGSEAFNGSDDGRARSAVASALSSPPEARLSIVVHATGGGVSVDWTVDGSAPRGALLEVAVVERSRTVHVGGGENGGKTLRHTNVVRALDTSTLSRGDAHGTRDLKVGIPRGGASVVAWVQDASSLRVLGATRAPIQ